MVANVALEIQLAFNNNEPTKMHRLHRLMLIELYKDIPDLLVINNLLIEMEQLAESNKQMIDKLKKI